MATWKPFDKFIGFFKIEVLLKVRLLHGRFSRYQTANELAQELILEPFEKCVL